MIREGLSQGPEVVQRCPKVVQLSYLHDDFVSLGVFHERIIEQSFERVFSSGAVPYSVIVIG